MSPGRFGAILYRQRRAILLIAAAAVFTGIFSWTTMPRQEDPSLTARFGSILVIYPGGDADSIEELIVIPTEDQLRSVEEIAAVEVSIRPDVAAITVELDGRVRDVDPVWDEVESALRRAQREYPEGVEEPITNWEVTSVEAVIVGIGGSGDLAELWYAAEELERDLRRVQGVKEVNIAPDVDRELVVTLDEATSRQLGMSRSYLAGQLAERLVTIPGGQLRVGTVQAGVDPESGVDTMHELGETEIVLPSGASIPLSSVGPLYIGPAEPADASARLDNRSVVTVGVVPQQAIDIVAFGEQVISTVDRFSAEHPELTVDYASFQPRRVETRLSDLAGSLLQGIAIVAAVVILAMGVRLGLTVAAMVPVVALGGLALYAVAGGVLHQISIAALVMSLGLLVDNAIVVAERIQWRLDAGEDRKSAAGAAVRELLVPLAAATGTTLAAYIPLLLARGETAEFTGAIPRLVMLTLTLSYFFAVIVTPTIAMMVLRPSGNGDGTRDGATLTMAETSPALRRVSHFSTRRPWLVIAGALVGVILVATLLPRVQQQFFPSSDRNQLVIDIETPRGTHIGETSRVVATLEQALLEREEVVQVAAFAGRTAPRFYYNVLTVTNAPYRGQILVTTTTSDVVEPMTEWIRRRAREITPEAVVVARKLEQGPPVDAPIQLRVAGEDFQRVASEVQNIIGSLQEIPGAVDVRSTLSAPTLTLSLAIDDARANALGINRASIAQAVRAAVRGIPAGEISYREERIPVIVRSPAGEDYDAAQFDDIQLFSPVGGGLVPLAAVARVRTEFRPSEITRRNGVRTASVLAELAPGAAYNEVLATLNDRLEPPIEGVERTVGGAAEESAAANRAIANASYLGVVVLLTILLLQFRSFRKVGIVMTTVPLAAVGVIPGLLIFNQPFGFTSMLGVIALIGIVVNNAIILIDLMDAKRDEGLPLDAAIRGAVEERIRPILLTAGTTIAGMVPLLFSSSSLWPPFAGSIISGLAASTVLTILVVPAMYRLMFARPTIRQRGIASRAALFLCGLAFSLFGVAYPSSAQDADDGAVGAIFADIVDGARANAASRAAALDVAAADRGLVEARRSALLPALSIEGEVLRRNEALTVPSPGGGTIEEEPDWEGQVVAVLSQPVFDLAVQVGEPALRSAAVRTAAAQAREEGEAQVIEALFRSLDVVDVDSAVEAASISGAALRAQYERVTRLVDGGRAIQSDADRIEIALLQVERDLRTFVLRREVVADDLARLIGRRRPVDVPSSAGIARVVEHAERLYRNSPYHGDDASWRQRNDLVSLGSVIEETIAAERSVHFQRLPSVEAQLRGINVLNSALEQDYWIEAAVVLRWVPYARGARVAAADRVRQLRLATEERYTAAIEAVEVELHQRSVDFEIALDRYRVQERSLQLAERLEAETAQLFEAGRRTSTDYVEAQAEVRRERTARDQAATQAIRAFFAWRRARGLEIVPRELIDLE